MTKTVSEKDLLKEFLEAKQSRKDLEEKLNEAKRILAEKESNLIELLEANSAESTAKYENIGHATLGKPRLYAGYDKEREAELFDYLDSMGMGSLIKNTVQNNVLSSFVREMIERGDSIPEFIHYYLKPSLRAFSNK